MGLVTSGWDVAAVRQAVLNQTNTYRSTHHVSTFTANATLQAAAQSHADTCATQDYLVQVSNSYGRNIGFVGSADILSTAAAKAAGLVTTWYNEEAIFRPYYGMSSPPNGAYMHFTQMVWKGSTNFGVGAAINTANKLYLVCYFQNAGNMVGAFATNVLRP